MPSGISNRFIFFRFSADASYPAEAYFCCFRIRSGGFEPKRSENDRGDRGLAPVSSDISAIQSIRLPFRFRLLLHHKGQREVHESPEAAYQARAAV